MATELLIGGGKADVFTGATNKLAPVVQMREKKRSVQAEWGVTMRLVG